MTESSGSTKAQYPSSRYPELKKLKRKGERERLAKREDGSEIEIKGADVFWVSNCKWIYSWALG